MFVFARRLAVVAAIFFGIGPCYPLHAFGPHPVHITSSIEPKDPRPGETAVVSVSMQIDRGYHVYSSQKSGSLGPVQTQILSVGNWKPVGDTVEDAPVVEHDPGFDMQIGTHRGRVLFQRAFRVVSQNSRSIPPVSVRYQSCTEKSCLPPRTDTSSLAGVISSGPIRPVFTTAVYTVDQTAPSIAPLPITPGSPGDQSSILLFVLAAAGGGLLALATPCVFPLIPIILTTFIKQSNGDRRRFVAVALGFSAGITLLFAAIGVIFTAVFGAAGISSVATNPYVNLAEFVIFVVFAFSFFDIVHIQLPAGLAGLQRSKDAHGIAGLALMGMAFVVASFTCTAPFIGTLLVTAASGAVAKPLIGMVIFALFFCMPFLISTVKPNWIDKVPRSGAWLVKTKAVIGFIELAAALKFLSNADLVWQWKLLTKPVMLSLWTITFLAASAYLFGLLRWGITAEDKSTKTSRVQRTWGLMFFVVAMYSLWGAFGGAISPYTEAFLPASDYGRPGYGKNEGLPWRSDYKTALAEAKAARLPLLIDFTGYTCSNCRLNERRVFPDPEIQKLLGNYVRVQLYTDGGSSGAANQNLQQKLFSDISLPLYGVVDPTTGRPLQKIGGVVNVGQFRDFLAKGGAAAGAAK